MENIEETKKSLFSRKGRIFFLAVLLVAVSIYILIYKQLQLTSIKNQARVAIIENTKPTASVNVDDFCRNNLFEFNLEDAAKNPGIVCSIRVSPSSSQSAVAELSKLGNSLMRLETLYLNKTVANFSKEIADLQNLKVITFHHTSNTIIPPEFGRLKNLKVLFMTKADIQNLPLELGNLSGLEKIIITQNSYPVKLPESTGDLENLKLITLNNNGLVILPNSLYKNHKLETVDVGNNNLFYIPHVIFKIKNLKQLSLEKNKLSIVPYDLSLLLQLKHLRLNDNLIEYISDLSGFQNLEYINLSNNRLSELPKGISELPKLKYLNLSGNNINESELINLKNILKNTVVIF